MSLAPHTRLGPYEIVAPLGADGMGEVCRARDKRLDCDVAIKGIPCEPRRRFSRSSATRRGKPACKNS